MSISYHYNCENFSHRKCKAVKISLGEEASDGPQQKKKAKTESKIKMKLIDGKCKCVHVEYVYKTKMELESEQDDNASASESLNSPPVVKRSKCKQTKTKGTVTKEAQDALKEKRSHKITSQEKDTQNMQNTVMQQSKSATMDLAVNMLPVGV